MFDVEWPGYKGGEIQEAAQRKEEQSQKDPWCKEGKLVVFHSPGVWLKLWCMAVCSQAQADSFCHLRFVVFHEQKARQKWEWCSSTCPPSPLFSFPLAFAVVVFNFFPSTFLLIGLTMFLQPALQTKAGDAAKGGKKK